MARFLGRNRTVRKGRHKPKVLVTVTKKINSSTGSGLQRRSFGLNLIKRGKWLKKGVKNQRSYERNILRDRNLDELSARQKESRGKMYLLERSINRSH